MSYFDKAIDWWQENNRMSYLVYGILTVVVMGPMFLPGFILTLDMVFVPNPPLPPTVTNSYVLDVLLYYLSKIISVDIVQKLMLASILFFSGLGMHRLVSFVRPKSLAEQWPWAAWFAGLFYMINPFVYDRFMAGQYKVLLGYMLVPFIIKASLKYMARPDVRRLWPLVALVVLVGVFSVHVLGFVALLIAVIVGVSLWRRHTKEYILTITKLGLLGVVIFGLLSSYWLVPAFLGQGDIAQSVASFDNTDADAFATDGGLFSILQLQGFWLEAQGLFMPPEDPLPLSGFWQIIIWALVGTGAVVAWKLQRPIALIFGIIGLIATILALGGPLNEVLSRVVPFFAGYREPQKFVALLALAYAYFGAFGTAAIIQLVAQRFGQTVLNVALLIVLIVPILNTPTMLWGFYGQLTPRDYPADWYTMNQKLQELGDEKRILFLPWHLYMKFSFTQQIIANPAEKFFDAPIIASNDPEYAGISPQISDEVKAGLSEQILPNAATNAHLSQELQELGIGYVLLSKEGKENYAYLDQQAAMEVITESPNLRLYKIGGNHAED